MSSGLIREADHGTPIRVADEHVTLTIDGVEISAPKGTSVMAAAMMAGNRIPKLCATESLEPFGSCRLCLVEIEGRKGYAGLLHDARRARHDRAHARAATAPSSARGRLK